MSDKHISVLAEVIRNIWEVMIADEGCAAIRTIAENVATEFAYFDGSFDPIEFLNSCGVSPL